MRVGSNCFCAILFRYAIAPPYCSGRLLSADQLFFIRALLSTKIGKKTILVTLLLQSGVDYLLTQDLPDYYLKTVRVVHSYFTNGSPPSDWLCLYFGLTADIVQPYEQ